MNKELNRHLAKPIHGGDLLARKRQLSSSRACSDHALSQAPWIDLSSAVNRHPWPIPQVPDSLWQELPDFNELESAAKSYYGRENLLPIAGSQQAIEALPTLLFDSQERQRAKVLVPQIGYQEHGFAWQKWRYCVTSYDKVEEALTQTWQVLVLIQPNNPTGVCLSFDLLLRLVEKAQAQGAYLVVDEAFIDSQSQASLLAYYADKSWPEALILLRSVGKFFGLPGARVGFCFACESVLTALASVIGPWPIATPSVWLVAQALKDDAWQVAALADIQQRHERFITDIQPLLNGLCDTPSWQASELFFTCFCTNAEAVFQQLEESKIHVRMGEGWLRFALPHTSEFCAIRTRLT